MNAGTYATLSELKTALGITDTNDDTRFLAILEQASAFIDHHTQRWFQPRTATRYYSAAHSGRLALDADLLSVTTLKTDDDDDYDYDYTWSTTDYHLLPFNEFPKWEIRTKANGDYSFPANERGLEIAGLWGFGDGESATPYAADTTTAEELDASEVAVDVTSATNLNPGHTILVESEQMYVQSKSSNTLTVARGVNGTTAATHATAKTINIYRYPLQIKRACIRLASRTYFLESAPGGVRGSADMGTVEIVARSDPDFLHWVAPFRRLTVG